MNADTYFTRETLKLTHEFVRIAIQRMRSAKTYEFRPVFRPYPWEAASVTCSGKMGGVNKTYNVQIDLHETPKPYFWSGRAHNAYEARDRAWKAWLRSQEASAQ